MRQGNVAQSSAAAMAALAENGSVSGSARCGACPTCNVQSSDIFPGARRVPLLLPDGLPGCLTQMPMMCPVYALAAAGAPDCGTPGVPPGCRHWPGGRAERTTAPPTAATAAAPSSPPAALIRSVTSGCKLVSNIQMTWDKGGRGRPDSRRLLPHSADLQLHTCNERLQWTRSKEWCQIARRCCAVSGHSCVSTVPGITMQQQSQSWVQRTCPRRDYSTTASAGPELLPIQLVSTPSGDRSIQMQALSIHHHM